MGILPNQVRDIKIHKGFLETLKSMTNTAKYVMPFEIKKRALYTEILAEDANPKSIFDLPLTNPARAEYEKACSFIMEKVFNG